MNPDKTACLLVIDDAPENILVASQLLGNDYRMQFATSGPEALAALAAGEPPDLILLDVVMPAMDGYAVCAALKAAPATRDIPVIFVTARGDAQSETRALAAGGVDFIHKPLNAAVLRARIGVHLQLRRQAQALGQANTMLAHQAEALSAANAELAQHRNQLEQLVHARTQALAAALDQAEGANRAKSAFLATIGHELKTPLNQIMGTLHLVTNQLAETRLRDWLAMGEQAGRHLLRLIDDVLQYVESESRAIVVDDGDFALAALLDAALCGIRPAATAKGLALAVEVDPALPAWLKGDAPRLGRILDQLLDNAVKFSEHGRITLAVRQRAAQGTTCDLEFAVSDQGIGLAPAVQASLFQLFQQGDNRLSRRYGGTGLGLALCKRLVGCMAGEMGFSSTPGEGSRVWFRLSLPLGAAPVAPVGVDEVIDWASVDATVAALDRLLGEGDFALVPRWADAQALLEPVLGDRLAAIEAAIVDFEFETARRLLQEAVAARRQSPMDRDPMP